MKIVTTYPDHFFCTLDRLTMPSSTIFFLLIASFMMTTYGRTLTGPDQLMPLLFSSANTDENNIIPSSNGQNRLIHVVEQIIK